MNMILHNKRSAVIEQGRVFKRHYRILRRYKQAGELRAMGPVVDRYGAPLWALPLILACHHREADKVSERLRLDRIRFSARSALVGGSADSIQVTVVWQMNRVTTR